MTSTAPAPRPGEQLASTVCDTRVVVVRAPSGAAPRIACGGEPMEPAAGAAKPAGGGKTGGGKTGGGGSGDSSGTLLGKRYVDAAGTLELLCTSPGSGVLTCDGEPMAIKAAAPLPASD